MHQFRINLFGKEDKTLYAFTYIGKAVYIFALFLVISYTFVLYDNMTSQSKDSYKSFKMSNSLSDDEQHHEDHNHDGEMNPYNKSLYIRKSNEFYMNDLNFMPVYEIKAINSFAGQKFDIFKEETKEDQEANAFDASLKIDYQKLMKYVQIQMVVMTTKNLKTSSVIAEFKNCEYQDFERNGYKEEIQIGADKLLCPDVEHLKDRYKLRNGYENRKDRTAISIQMIACNPKMTKGCKKDKEIKKFLENIYITQYFVIEDIDFQNPENQGKRPVNPKFQFQQQFQLDFDSYRDNNNFIRENHIETVDFRFQINKKTNFYSFLDIIMGPAWIGSKLVNQEKVEDYLGQKFEKIDRHILQGSYYFISSERIVHERSLYTVQNLLGDLGGISVMLFNIAAAVAYTFSVQFVWGSMMHQLFFIYQSDDDIKTDTEITRKSHKRVRFSIQDHLWNSSYFKPILYALTCGKKSRNSIIFGQLYERVMKHMTITELVKRQNKMHALITSMFQNLEMKDEILSGAEKIYRTQVLVNLQNSNDYGLSCMKGLDQNQLFDKIGKFEMDYRAQSMMEKFRIDLMGESGYEDQTEMLNELSKRISERNKIQNDKTAPNVSPTTFRVQDSEEQPVVTKEKQEKPIDFYAEA